MSDLAATAQPRTVGAQAQYKLFALRAYYDELHPGSNGPWEVMNISD